MSDAGYDRGYKEGYRDAQGADGYDAGYREGYRKAISVEQEDSPVSRDAYDKGFAAGREACLKEADARVDKLKAAVLELLAGA